MPRFYWRSDPDASTSLHHAALGRGIARGWRRCHGKPSSSVASCAALKRTTPSAGEVFIFRPKRADRVKILVYDGTGLVLYAKRLEAGRFTWPSSAEGVVRLSAAQLATLLEGLPWQHLRRRTIPRPRTAW